MAEIKKISIALTAEQIVAMKSAVDAGEYATTSEVIREALREWQRKRDLQAEELKRLRQAWMEGKASGAPTTLDSVSLREEARKRLKKASSRTA